MSLRTTARLVTATAIVLSLVAGCGDDPDDGERTSPAPTVEGNPAGRALAYQVPGMTEIAATTETYADADGAPLEVDLYQPAAKGRVPVVLLLHGVTADASPKDYAGLVGWGQALAKSGVAAAVINYRADESGTGPGDADVKAAIEHLRADDRLDMSRWGLLTFSAGGPYGVRAAAAAPAGLSAVEFVYARTEPAEGAPAPATSLSALVGERPDLPVLAAYGALDNVPGIAESRRHLQHAVGREGNGTVTVLVHPTAGHGFDTRPDGDSTRIVRAGLEFLVDRLGG